MGIRAGLALTSARATAMGIICARLGFSTGSFGRRRPCSQHELHLRILLSSPRITNRILREPFLLPPFPQFSNLMSAALAHTLLPILPCITAGLTATGITTTVLTATGLPYSHPILPGPVTTSAGCRRLGGPQDRHSLILKVVLVFGELILDPEVWVSIDKVFRV